MRLALLIALAACSGPISPTHVGRTADAEPRVQRPPPNAPPDPIGTTRPGNRSCSENRDCKTGETCFAPDFTPSGPPPQCQTDAQCGNGQVCTGTTCAPPCSPDSCGPGQECRDAHCKPIACTDTRAAICSQNFRCNSASGACERLTCTSRAQCDTGFCYQGRCFAHDAYCMPQSYCCTP